MLRPTVPDVEVRCSEGLCPCYFLPYGKKRYPARALPLTREEDQSPSTPIIGASRLLNFFVVIHRM